MPDAPVSHGDSSSFVYAPSEHHVLLRKLSAVWLHVSFLQLLHVPQRVHMGRPRVSQRVHEFLHSSAELRIRHVYRRSSLVHKQLWIWRVVPDAAVSIFHTTVEYHLFWRLPTVRLHLS